MLEWQYSYLWLVTNTLSICIPCDSPLHSGTADLWQVQPTRGVCKWLLILGHHRVLYCSWGLVPCASSCVRYLETNLLLFSESHKWTESSEVQEFPCHYVTLDPSLISSKLTTWTLFKSISAFSNYSSSINVNITLPQYIGLKVMV